MAAPKTKAPSPANDTRTAVEELPLDATVASDTSLDQTLATDNNNNDGLGTCRSDVKTATIDQLGTCTSEASVKTALNQLGTTSSKVKTCRSETDTARGPDLKTAISGGGGNVATCLSQDNVKTAANDELLTANADEATCRSLSSVKTARSQPDLATAVQSSTSVRTSKSLEQVKTAKHGSNIRTAVGKSSSASSVRTCSQEAGLNTAIDSQPLAEEVVSQYCMDIDPGSPNNEDLSLALPSHYHLSELEQLQSATYGMKVQTAIATGRPEVSSAKSEYALKDLDN